MLDDRPLVAHVVHTFRIGGLENGIVNLINGLPQAEIRHAIVCLTGHDDFVERIRRADVMVYDLDKRPGQDPGLYRRAFRLFRALRPEVVHTRNLATLEMQLPAWLARVPARVHGEHGRDANDPDGTVAKYRLLRRAVRPVVHRYVPLSQELESYLQNAVGVPATRLTRICNGVDIARFNPGTPALYGVPAWLTDPSSLVIGVVARVDAVKNPLGLADAFIALKARSESWARHLRLVWIGDGPLRLALEERLVRAGHEQAVWLPGGRDDVANLMKAFDLFVLPSLAEGISNTLLEAMATGLPAVVTRVGGNPELVEDGVNALMVPRGDASALARAIACYAADSDMRAAHGRASRDRAQRRFSLDGMVAQYRDLYQSLIRERTTQNA